MQSSPVHSVELLSELQGRPATASGLFILDVFSYSCFSCKNNYGSENIFKNVV